MNVMPQTTPTRMAENKTATIAAIIGQCGSKELSIPETKQNKVTTITIETLEGTTLQAIRKQSASISQALFE